MKWHTTKNPFEGRLVKDVLKCGWEEFSFFCHDGEKQTGGCQMRPLYLNPVKLDLILGLSSVFWNTVDYSR